MGTALAVVALIAIVLAVGLLRDSMRTRGIESWAQAHGLKRVPTEEHDRERLIGWAGRFRPANAGHWGIVLRGDVAGFETTIGEHEERRTNSPARWHTLAVCRVPDLQLEAVRITKAGSQFVRAVTDAATAPGVAARESLGIEVTERLPVQPVGSGKWAVEAANENARTFWSSGAQAVAIDAWPYESEIAAADDHVLVRVPGLIAADGLDNLLVYLNAARELFTHAAAARTAR